MATIPDVPNRSRLPDVPHARMGIGGVSAADFGDQQFQDYARLARAFQIDGANQMQWATRKDREKVEAEGLAANATIKDLVNKRREELFQKKGSEAATVREDLEKYTKEQSDKIREGLSTDRAREYYDKSIQDYVLQNNMAADRHRIRQDAAALEDAYSASKEMLIEDSIAIPGDEVRIAGNIKSLKERNAKQYAGSAPEVVENINNNDIMRIAEEVAAARSTEFGPEAALDFLNSGIDAEFSTDGAKAKFSLLKKKYEAERDKKDSDRQDADAELYAIQQLDGGESLLDLQPELIEKYGSDRGKIAYQAAATREALRNNAMAKEAKDLSEKRWNDFYESGEIPEGVTRQERAAMLKEQASKAKGEMPADPWAFGQYLMDNYTPEELRQMQRDGKWSEIYPKLLYGGKNVGIVTELNDYMNGIKGTMTPEKYARMQFRAVTGLNPASKISAQKYNQFMDYFTEAAEQRAEALNLDDIRRLPRDEQDKILANLLEVGDWGFWGRDRFRFQVMGESDYQSSFTPHASQPYRRTTAAGAAAPFTGGAPSVAPELVGPRDEASGNTITTNRGVVQQVDGDTITVSQPRRPERPERVRQPGEPEIVPPALQSFLDSGAEVTWDGKGWQVNNGVSTFYIDTDGLIYG